MADIRVSLILNGNQYIGELNRATVATERFKDKAESAGNGITGSFSKVTALAATLGAAFVALGVKTMTYADQVTDLADAYGTSVGNVVALTKALEQAGGKGDNAGRVFLEMSKSINEANQGNLKTLSTFERLGISIADLGAMGEDQIRNKLIRALAEMPAGVERTALQFQLFGKALNGVDIRRLSAELDNSQGKYDKYSQSLKTAGDAADNLAKIMGDIKMAFAQAFEPVFAVIANIKVPVEALTVAFRALAAAMLVVIAEQVLVGFAKLTAAVKSLTLMMARNPLILLLSVLAAVGIAAADAAGFLDKLMGATSGSADATNDMADATANAARNQDGLNEKLSKARETLTKIGEQQAINNKAALERLDIEGKTIWESESRKQIIQEIGKIETDTQQKILDLKKAFNGLDAEMQGRVRGEYEGQLDIIRQQGDEQKKNVEVMLTGIQNAKLAFNDYARGFEILNDVEAKKFKINMSINPVNEAGSIQREEGLNALIQKRQILLQEIAKQNYSPVLQDIATDMMKNFSTYEQAVTNFNQRTQGQYADQVAQLMQGTSRQIEAVDASLRGLVDTRLRAMEETRKFSYGWESAFNKFADDATNAAKIAERMFSKFTAGVEDLIVNFVKTGKFEWKDFVNTMAEELLRAQIQRTIANVLGATGLGNTYTGSSQGGGGIISGIRSLLGFANGGVIPTNGPVVVGERGPELLYGAAGSTVVPNSALGGGNVTYNINAVDAWSFKQLVAQDPSFIHAIAMQGAKSIPATRR